MKSHIRIFFLFIFFLPFLVFKTTSVFAEETGFRFPTTCTTNGPSCENMQEQDSLYSSWINTHFEEVYVTFTDLGIPNNVILDDIQIKLRIKTSISGMTWEPYFSDNNGQKWRHGRVPCLINPNSCLYNTSTVFNSINSHNLTFENANPEVNITGLLLNSPQFLFMLTNPGGMKNTDIDTLLFNIRYHIEEVQDPVPTPFLDLPWNYEGQGLSFSDAALSINSFFDHEYPLLSTSLFEGPSATGSAITYLGYPRQNKPYSTHDGYDWGRRAKATLGEPVLAAANGTATYMNSCGACGNAILIDHGNGYQTRYYHLQKDGLITNATGQSVSVTAGEVIGKVGATGNVSPKGDLGAHIHFMVVYDKDGNGSFNDNIPDGLIDPFGWQGTDPDPWPLFSFNYLGSEKTGTSSAYLWKKKLDDTTVTIGDTGGSVSVGQNTLTFPPGFTSQDLKINLVSEPTIETSAHLISVGTSFSATAKNSLGNSVTDFTQPFTITIDFSGQNLSSLDENTLSIYSSENGTHWTPEETTINLLNNTATAEVNHMTHFTLMGERKDNTAPTTSAILDGLRGEIGWYRSNVLVTLDPKDNEEGSGIDYTLYKLGNNDWEVYRQPLNFTQEGHYSLEFYSADKDENIEDIKSIGFTIDKTVPEAKIFVDPSKLDLTVEATDSAETQVVKSENNLTKRKDDALYTIIDQAGNILTLDVRDIDNLKRDSFSLFSTVYNDSTLTQPKNQYIVTYSGKKIPQNVSNQTFSINNQVKIRIAYNNKKNESTIFTQEKGQEKVKEVGGS